MIEGNAWKARIKPIEPFSPGGMARGPKRNRIPSKALSMIFMVTSLRKRKICAPKGIRKTKSAKTSCKPIPQNITRKLTRFLFLENKNKKATKKRMPKAEIIL